MIDHLAETDARIDDAVARQEVGHEADAKNYDELCKVAEAIKSECDKRKLGIMMLQPFANSSVRRA